MRRREFITLLGGAAATWPLGARAQQMPRVGVLMALSAADSEGQARLAAFLEGLRELGWADGRNVRIDIRWAGGKAEDARKYADELVALMPAVILASGASAVGPLREVTGTVPVVFTQTSDPVGVGFVASLAHPGGNITGFTQFEVSIGVKWVELLKQIAPDMKRVAVVRDPTSAAAIGQWGAIQGAASSFGAEVSPLDARDADTIERAIAEFALRANGGVIVTSGGQAIRHRKLIIALASKYKLPVIYPYPLFAKDGGLIAYGPDSIDPHKRAASYVDRILKGEKPGDLPVQAPTKYILAINLRTAKAFGLTVPATLLARADEVIE